MPISFRRSVPLLLLCLFSLPASQAIGQEANPEATPITPFMKQMNRIDLAVSAAGSLSTSISGIEQRDAHVVTSVTLANTPPPGTSTIVSTSSTLLAIKPSGTVGELVTLRYTAKPYVGFEFNFGNIRNTQDYKFTTTTATTTTNNATTPPTVTTATSTSTPNLLFGGVQSNVRELTLGYVAHLPFHPFGIQPFVGAGGGTIRFKPTTGGGQGLGQQYRAAYYYTLGLEDEFPNSHFGVRVGFRQLIYLAPDFLQNYLTITRRVSTSEPTIGLYLRF
jgi:hypothetical protein